MQTGKLKTDVRSFLSGTRDVRLLAGRKQRARGAKKPKINPGGKDLER